MKKNIKTKTLRWDVFDIASAEGPSYCGSFLGSSLEEIIGKTKALFSMSSAYTLKGESYNTLTYEVKFEKRKWLRIFTINPPISHIEDHLINWLWTQK
jgi:hypothetical protein